MDITKIVCYAVALIVSIAAILIVPYIRSKTTSEQFAIIQMWVGVAVKAAEQLFVGSGRGEEKKAYVLEFLEGKGFTIDLDSVDAMIEAAVLDLKKALSV